MEGFIQLHKKICEWEWYTDIPTKTLFFHIMLKCNFKEVKWRGKIIKPGEFITSLEHLSIDTGLTRQQVRTAIRKLESTGEVTHFATNDYTTIVLNNWEAYNTQDNKRTTNEQQTNNKRTTTTNKNNKENKEYNENNIISIDTEKAPSYGKEELNMMQGFLRQAVGLDKFKDSKERWYVQHCYNLLKAIGREEFEYRLKEILSDPFKSKNCNKLAYLYGELKSFIHSPIVELKTNQKPLNPDPLLRF